MNTVFLHPDLSIQPSGSIMNSVSGAIPSPLVAAAAAANADELGEARAAAANPSTTQGWDAYEVWRRFIKDARERRQQQE